MRLTAHIYSMHRLAGLEFDALLPGHVAISLSRGRRHGVAAAEAFHRLVLPPPLVS